MLCPLQLEQFNKPEKKYTRSTTRNIMFKQFFGWGSGQKIIWKINKVIGPIVYLFEVLFLATLLVWLSVCKAMKTVHLFPPFFHSALLIATFHFLERKFPPLLNDVPHFIFMNPKPFTLFFKKYHTLAKLWSKMAIFMTIDQSFKGRTKGVQWWR